MLGTTARTSSHVSTLRSAAPSHSKSPARWAPRPRRRRSRQMAQSRPAAAAPLRHRTHHPPTSVPLPSHATCAFPAQSPAVKTHPVAARPTKADTEVGDTHRRWEVCLCATRRPQCPATHRRTAAPPRPRLHHRLLLQCQTRPSARGTRAVRQGDEQTTLCRVSRASRACQVDAPHNECSGMV
jgi:hypothetical protein